MPIMVPPGQGVTVTTPVGQTTQPAAPARQQAPPSPFRPVHGPDVVIMPHHKEEEPQPVQGQPPQPAQMSRRGSFLQLMRSKLKLQAGDPFLRQALQEAARQHVSGEAPPDNPALIDLIHEHAQTPEQAQAAHLWHWYQTVGKPAAHAVPPQSGGQPLHGTSEQNMAAFDGHVAALRKLGGNRLLKFFDHALGQMPTPAPGPQSKAWLAQLGVDHRRGELAAAGHPGLVSGPYPYEMWPLHVHPHSVSHLLARHGADPRIGATEHRMDAAMGRVSRVVGDTGQVRSVQTDGSQPHPYDAGWDHLARTAGAFREAAERHLGRG